MELANERTRALYCPTGVIRHATFFPFLLFLSLPPSLSLVRGSEIKGVRARRERAPVIEKPARTNARSRSPLCPSFIFLRRVRVREVSFCAARTLALAGFRV